MMRQRYIFYEQDTHKIRTFAANFSQAMTFEKQLTHPIYAYVQQAADALSDAVQSIKLDEIAQNSGLLDTLQNAVSQIGGAG